MNVYVVMEDEVGAKKVYESWIPLVNPNLKLVSHPSQLINDNFVVYTGGGYPFIYELIKSAIEDANTYCNADRIVIAVDSENKTRDDRYTEIRERVATMACRAEIKIVIQHFCFETWALGHKLLIGHNPKSKRLAKYRRFHNVHKLNPEEMPAYPEEELNRSQFAFEYLRLAINEKNHKLAYSKSNPSIVQESHFFEQVRRRFETTGHISSFQSFLEAFV